MSSSFGNKLKVSLFGASHGSHVGVLLEGLMAGEVFSLEKLYQFMARRAPKKSLLSTLRKEADMPIFLSGISEEMTTGCPICAVIENQDAHSKDYEKLKDIPRPSHADYTARLRFGDKVDLAGGGHFSGRLTAPLCVAGGLALQLLEKRGVRIYARLSRVGEVQDDRIDYAYPDEANLLKLRDESVPMLSEVKSKMAKNLIEELRSQGDSIGGEIECVVLGYPKGKGSPLFDALESRLAAVLFGISGVKGVSFGSGFLGTTRRGSQENDAFYINEGEILTKTNHSGGIQGGISNGMPIIFQVAMKPTPSIALSQESVSLSKGENVHFQIEGRHDPCIALRAVPVIEAACALVLLDELL